MSVLLGVSGRRCDHSHSFWPREVDVPVFRDVAMACADSTCVRQFVVMPCSHSTADDDDDHDDDGGNDGNDDIQLFVRTLGLLGGVGCAMGWKTHPFCYIYLRRCVFPRSLGDFMGFQRAKGFEAH